MPKDSRKYDRLVSLISKLAAEYISREPSGNGLFTVTGVKLSPDKSNATIYFTVLPESEEKAHIEELKRRGGLFRQYVEDHSRLGYIPFLHFELDLGEKNRQKIEEISQKTRKSDN